MHKYQNIRVQAIWPIQTDSLKCLRLEVFVVGSFSVDVQDTTV